MILEKKKFKHSITKFIDAITDIHINTWRYIKYFFF